jgi:hypothetical protein
MTISAHDATLATAVDVGIDDTSVTVQLADGRTLTMPLAWYPRLAAATREERDNWRLVGRGAGINWPSIEEDLSVASMLAGRRSGETEASFQRWLADRK